VAVEVEFVEDIADVVSEKAVKNFVVGLAIGAK